MRNECLLTMFGCLLPFTLSAAPLQTLLLRLKVVAVASAASIVESLAPLGGGVVEEAQLEGIARPDVHRRRAGLCTQSDRWCGRHWEWERGESGGLTHQWR